MRQCGDPPHRLTAACVQALLEHGVKQRPARGRVYQIMLHMKLQQGAGLLHFSDENAS